MISLPDWPAPRSAQKALVDFGAVLRPATGAAVQRVNRKGNRWRLQVEMPPMRPDLASLFIARLVRAKTAGLRMEVPLAVPQGAPGNPVVNGAGAAGTTLPIRGLTRGFVIREGYWLSIEDENGQHFLHMAAAAVRANAAGEAGLPIVPELRVPFADGAAIHLARPMVEGFVEGDELGWTLPLDRLIQLTFPLEEAA